MVSVSVDIEANAMYVSLKKGVKIKKTISLGEDRFMDVDESGAVVGIEILLPTISQEVKESFLRSKDEIVIQ